jgi:hydroxymethylbilane synthase
MKTLRMGIRKSRVSKLAVRQLEEQFAELYPELSVEVVACEGSVQYSPDDPEAYVQELEPDLIDGKVDVVVHLLKEIPVRLPEQICLIGVTERITPFDAFVSRDFASLDSLPDGARVGVSHLRQKTQLMLYRYDLEIVEIHGSVDSRLQQMESQNLAGILISAESLERLGMQDQASEIVAEEILLPAPGQGCLGFLARRDREEVAELMVPFVDQTSRLEAIAERAFLDKLGGNPEIALGVRAALYSHSMIVEGVLASSDAGCFIRDAIQGPPDLAATLGSKLAELLLVLGDDKLQNVIEPVS